MIFNGTKVHKGLSCAYEAFLFKNRFFLSKFVTGSKKYLTTVDMGKRKNKLPDEKNRPPSAVNLVVVGTGGPGTSKCLLLTTEQSRYMFNCGEGCQRFTVMNRCLRSSANARVTGIDNVFLTHKNWENTGGLLGVAMLIESQKNPELKNYLRREKQTADAEGASNTINDGLPEMANLPELILYGPDGVENITMMARKFSERSNMNIVRKEGVFEDHAIKISPVVFSSKKSSHQEASAGISKLKDNDEAYAYICTAKRPFPKINVAKCVDAGIAMGPMVGELQRGNPVTLPDGTIVKPEQVTDIPSIPNSFIVVECPSPSHFESLESSSQLDQFRGKDRNVSLDIIVHMTPATVFNSPVYQDWMRSFGETTDHLVMNEEASPADLPRVRRHQAQLNLVDPVVFPLLRHTQLEEKDNPLPSDHKGKSEGKSGTVVKACSGLFYTLRGRNPGPGFHLDTDEFVVETIQQNVLKDRDAKKELDNLHNNVLPLLKSMEENQLEQCQYPKVVFLGTGSSEPNRVRAQSCIAVQLSEDFTIMLDCGEDSYGQLFRFYGQDETRRVLSKLKAIFVSHLHGDHHLGLLTLLKERKKAFEVNNIPFIPVLVMAPIQMKRWLKFYHLEVEEVFHLFKFHYHQRGLKEYPERLMVNQASDEDIRKDLGFIEYNPVDVIHTPNSFGVAFTHESGFKLVYSGDTRPCDRLVKAGQGCDLLIHEATHEDDLLPHALASKHSTFSEAVEIGKRMKAKHVILTHFSQRYAFMVPCDGLMPPNAGIAFDNMQVTQASLPLLQSFIAPLTHIFADRLHKNELKAMKLKRTREQAKLDVSL